MNYSVYSHYAGADRVPEGLQNEVADAIAGVRIRLSRGTTSSIRNALILDLMSKGWSREVPISKDSRMTITSSKSGVGLCLQTGNMARMYADLLKLQKLYMDSAIASAVMIVLSTPVAKLLGNNLVHGTRLERELEIFQRVIHIPMVLFVIE